MFSRVMVTRLVLIALAVNVFSLGLILLIRSVASARNKNDAIQE